MEPPAATAPRRVRGFYAIAHRAGNNLHDLERALEEGVDAIECDFWHDRGKLELRHERKIPVLPVLYGPWYLRWSWGQLSLPRLLREVNFRADLFLDIKSTSRQAAASVLALHRDLGAMMPKTRVSSRHWRVLDRLSRADTEMEMFYSIGRRRDVAKLLTRAEGARPPAGTSIRHTLLSPELVRRLHGSGVKVYAWTVNNERRADELVGWGVDGIIADNLDALRANGVTPDR